MGTATYEPSSTMTAIKFVNLGEADKIEHLVALAVEWIQAGFWSVARVNRYRSYVGMYRRMHRPDARTGDLLEAFVGIARKRVAS